MSEYLKIWKSEIQDKLVVGKKITSYGNTVQDGLKNLQISYNFLNLPSVVTQDDTPVAEYSWFADGSKYRVLTQQNNGYIYTGSLIYASNSGNLQIESTDFAGGRINLVENTSTNALSQDIHYFHTDHLGSVRAITDNSGSVIEQNAYYPFGSRHTFGNTYAQTTNRFKFNGKEEQTTGNLNYLDYGARMYDSNIARRTTQDPLAEKYYSQSPYNYCVNNPVIFVDPDGNSIYSKVVKAAFKLGKAVYKNGIKSLVQASSYAETFADVIGDVNTLFDKDASGIEKTLAFGSLLSEISPVSINDVKDGVKIAKRIHGNSKSSTKAQHAYDIIDTESNTVVKTGVSGGRIRKDGKSSRAEQQVRKWNREENTTKYESNITNIEPDGEGAREKIYNYEKQFS